MASRNPPGSCPPDETITRGTGNLFADLGEIADRLGIAIQLLAIEGGRLLQHCGGVWLSRNLRIQVGTALAQRQTAR